MNLDRAILAAIDDIARQFGLTRDAAMHEFHRVLFENALEKALEGEDLDSG